MIGYWVKGKHTYNLFLPELTRQQEMNELAVYFQIARRKDGQSSMT